MGFIPTLCIILTSHSSLKPLLTRASESQLNLVLSLDTVISFHFLLFVDHAT